MTTNHSTTNLTDTQTLLAEECIAAAERLAPIALADVMGCNPERAARRLAETRAAFDADKITGDTINVIRRIVADAIVTHPLAENRDEYARLNVELSDIETALDKAAA